MPAPKEILDLVQRFESNIKAYVSSYNETQVRVEFVNPFFKALGWDVENTNGLAEAYKDVIHEDAIKVGKSTKAPDYCFRIGGTRKFFLETKKPSIKLKEDVPAAFQLRRYGWSAKLALSILTDFEELAIYDCRIKPTKTDKASQARISFYTYKDYIEKWDEIAGIFSKEAVLKGSFDKFADLGKNKRGTETVDDAFLEQIDSWRKDLAKNIAIRNAKISQQELNFSVQVILDRLIFLRICEDRGIEDYGKLLSNVNGQNVYKRLCESFRQADARYNSGLFHFQKEKERHTDPDSLTLNLKIDDDLLRDIIENFYFPESPYEFSVLPADILGQVYERFLGKVIRLTEGHQAKVEDKPEVKKAGGVFYTPTYVVDYIVENTVGNLLKGSNPKKAASLKILDPACGSGSFLIGAYQKMLDWHLEWYVADGLEKWSVGKNPTVHQSHSGWRLTTAKRKEILTNNIYGVDIDPQAVEVTKLSLLLKVLEGESGDTLAKQLKLFQERALPDLDDNIKCGNSLISSDNTHGKQMALTEDFGGEANAFSWKNEFKDIFSKGGFDCVVGNPPYLKIEHISEEQRRYFLENYDSIMKRFDSYGLFVEGSKDWLKKDGYFGMIIPSTILNNMTFKLLRKYIVENFSVSRIVNLGGKVFKNATNDTLILIFKNGLSPEVKCEVFDVKIYGERLETAMPLGEVDLVALAKEPDFVFELRVTQEDRSLFQKLATGRTLSDVCSCFQGFVTGGNEAYIVDAKEAAEQHLEKAILKPAVFGDEIKRYKKPTPKYRVIFLTRDSEISDFPNVKKRLEPFKKKLESKREVQNGRQPWYALHWARVKANYEIQPKILVQAIRNLSLKRRVVGTLDSSALYADHTLNVLIPKSGGMEMAVVLAFLNSKLVNYFFLKKYIDINIKGIYLEAIPLPISITNENVEEIKNASMELISLNEILETKNTPHEQESTSRRIEEAERHMDQLIYSSFGLSKDEIAIVENHV